jgi:Arc/MetJ-type ribon-helix-helix transcriptional regulator
MSDMNITLTADLADWIKVRLAQGRHTDASDFICDLIRREQEGLPPCKSPQF